MYSSWVIIVRLLQLVGLLASSDRLGEPLTLAGGCRSGGASVVSYDREFR